MATIKSEEFDGRVAEIYDCIAGSKEALVDAKDRDQQPLRTKSGS